MKYHQRINTNNKHHRSCCNSWTLAARATSFNKILIPTLFEISFNYYSRNIDTIIILLHWCPVRHWLFLKSLTGFYRSLLTFYIISEMSINESVEWIDYSLSWKLISYVFWKLICSGKYSQETYMLLKSCLIIFMREIHIFYEFSLTIKFASITCQTILKIYMHTTLGL